MRDQTRFQLERKFWWSKRQRVFIFGRTRARYLPLGLHRRHLHHLLHRRQRQRRQWQQLLGAARLRWQYWLTAPCLRDLAPALQVTTASTMSYLYFAPSKTAWPNYTKFFVCVACGHSRSSSDRQHCDTLCTPGFMDGITFSYHGTNRWMALEDNIRLQGRLTSSKLPILSVMSDNYSVW